MAILLDRGRTMAAAPPAELFASDTFRRSIGTDMPSMPLAHNMRPVTATATGAPGEYQARLTVEMHGDWALRLKVGGPVKDQIVEVLRFTATAAGPPPRKSAPAPGEHKH